MGRPSSKRDEAGRPLMIPAFGPAIPVVPAVHFSMSADRKTLEMLWQITGPSAMRNITRGHQLWEVIACAYAEGLHHGSQLERKHPEEVHKIEEQYREVPVKRQRKGKI